MSEAGDSRKDILAARTGNVTECQAKEAGWGPGEADTRPFRRRGGGAFLLGSGLHRDGVWLLFNSSTDTCLVPQAEDLTPGNASLFVNMRGAPHLCSLWRSRTQTIPGSHPERADKSLLDGALGFCGLDSLREHVANSASLSEKGKNLPKMP